MSDMQKQRSNMVPQSQSSFSAGTGTLSLTLSSQNFHILLASISLQPLQVADVVFQSIYGDFLKCLLFL